jgi:mannose-1-phosphate guanylyltransferase/phosphomannomutase
MRPEALAHIPPGECLDLGRDVFPRMVRDGARLFGYATDEYLKDVGTPERLREAEEDILQGRFPNAGSPAAP